MFRIGQGFDIHKLIEGRKLILGGVELEYNKGLLGHSDADALAHSIIDALLGALALGDIGTHFPDNDAKYKDIDSMILLEQTNNLIKQNGYEIVNIDNTIFAQEPKMKQYIPHMQKKLCSVLNINESQLSIKAKTMEEQDAVGQKLAISTQSIVLLKKN